MNEVSAHLHADNLQCLHVSAAGNALCRCKLWCLQSFNFLSNKKHPSPSFSILFKSRKLLDEGIPALNLGYDSGVMVSNEFWDDNFDDDNSTEDLS